MTSPSGDEEEHARWQSQDSPSFPAPLCTAIPPKKPNRQLSKGNESSFASLKCISPSIPRRRFSNVLDARLKSSSVIPTKRPHRQQSTAKPQDGISESLSLSSCDQNDSITTEEEDVDHLQLHESSTSMAPPELPPKRPFRQPSVATGLDPALVSDDSYANTPDWALHWVSQGESNDSSTMWDF
jgi:hypothetical protein